MFRQAFDQVRLETVQVDCCSQPIHLGATIFEPYKEPHANAGQLGSDIRQALPMRSVLSQSLHPACCNPAQP